MQPVALENILTFYTTSSKNVPAFVSKLFIVIYTISSSVDENHPQHFRFKVTLGIPPNALNFYSATTLDNWIL